MPEAKPANGDDDPSHPPRKRAPVNLRLILVVVNIYQVFLDLLQAERRYTSERIVG